MQQCGKVILQFMRRFSYMMVTLTKIPSSNANFVETFEDPLLDILL